MSVHDEPANNAATPPPGPPAAPAYKPGGITGKGWKPGQSGNPNGRPKGESMVALLRRILEQEHNGRVLKEILAERLVKEALAGKVAFVKEVLDRTEGPVGQKHEVSLDLALESISDDQFIGLARKHNRLDLLPPRLRAVAEEQDRRRLAGEEPL